MERLTQEQEQLAMLQRTLRLAVSEIPYYRDRAELYGVELDDLADLGALPLLRPEQFTSEPYAFCASEEWPAVVSYSSATTGSMGRPRWHAIREVEALREFVGQDASEDDRGAHLLIHPFDQSPILQAPGATGQIYVPLLIPWHYELILELLREGWHGPAGRVHIRQVTAFSPALRIYSVWLADRGIDPAGFEIRCLQGYGSIQPRAWRRRLRHEWGAHYRDRYGLSEVKGSDTLDCPLCGANHFLRPVIAEVVHPRTEQPLKTGTGVLVLTELVPYAQLQVLIRYWTADLVEITRPCAVSELGIRFRGRLADSVIVESSDGKEVVLGALEVGEVCADLPEIALDPIPWAAWATDAGPPRFRLEPTDDGARIVVELRFTPELYPAATKRVESQLREALGKEIEELQGLDDPATRLEIQVVAPGKLGRRTKV